MIVSVGEQDRQGDLVGGLLPRGALDEGDHPVDEGLAGLRRDLHDDPVGQHGRATGDGAAVAAGLADHRGGLAGDRRLVDGGHALDDVAVAGDDLAGLDDDEVADRAGPRPRPAPRCRRRAAGGPWSRSSGRAQRGRLGLAAALGDGLGHVGEEHGRPEPDGDRRGERPRGPRRPGTVVSTEPTHTTKMTGLRHTWRGSSLAKACGTTSLARAAECVMTVPPRWDRGPGPGRR